MKEAHSVNQQAAAAKGQIFKNPFLEALTKTTPLITFATYGTVVAFFLFLSYREHSLSLAGTAISFLTGLVFWTLFEYIMHRYIFHWVSDMAAAKKFTYALHGVHHEDPRDQERLFMPPVPGLLIIGVVSIGVKLALGDYAFAFLGGWLLGYMLYAYVHYKVHDAKPPRVLKQMWIHHNLHHYRYPDKAYGVSTPIWDIVFRTMPPSAERSRNEKGETKEGGQGAPMYVIHSKAANSTGGQ
jgi:sterol desaturase/sphingolipid hydroxylase (fatty acid hydroxylase superfamily)